MELTQGQISEIISNYTSSSEGFVTLQSLIMNSLMAHERELFVKANKNEQRGGCLSQATLRNSRALRAGTRHGPRHTGAIPPCTERLQPL